MIVMRGWTRLGVTVLAGVCALTACRGGERDERADVGATSAATAMAEPGGVATAPPSTDTGPTTSALGDPGIAFVAVTANSIDSAGGVMAERKAKNPEVKAFGERMQKDHGMVNKEAVALVTKLNLTPTDNDIARSLQAGATAAQDTLNRLSGAAFDSAYIAHEVASHTALLESLDRTLIPGAQNPELKALLVKVRPAVAAHLALAQNIQGKLAKP